MTHHTVTTKQSGSRFKLIGEIITELKKVVWLTRRQAIYLTALVLVACIIASLVMGGIDYGFTHLISGLFLGG